MGMRRGKRATSGQMTIELAVAMPVLIAVMVIAANAMTFFVDCAVFDRVACEAVRVHAAAPSYRQGVDQTCSLVEQAVRSECAADNLEVSVSHSVVAFDFDEYTATLEYYPTLFGRGLRSGVFGVSLPHLTHNVRYVVDSYRAGVVV